RPHRDEEDLAVLHRSLQVRGEAEALFGHVARQQLGEARLVDRDFPPAQRVDLGVVVVDARDAVAGLCEARPDHEAGITPPPDADLHPCPPCGRARTACAAAAIGERSTGRAGDSRARRRLLLSSPANELRPRPASLARPLDGRRGIHPLARGAAPRPGPGRSLLLLLGVAPRPLSRGPLARQRDARGPPDPGPPPQLPPEPAGRALARPPRRRPARPRPLPPPAPRPRPSRAARGDGPRPLLPHA